MKSIRIPIILVSLSFGVMSFLLPIYSKAVDMDAMEIGGLFSIFSLVVLVIKPFIGRWADKKGYKPVLVIGMALYALSFFVFAWMSSIGSMYLARVIQGVAAAMFGISTYGIVIGAAKQDEMAQRLGERTSATTIGILLGSMMCFFMLYGVAFMEGWRRLFVTFAIAAAMGSIMVMRTYCEIKKMPTKQKCMNKKLSVNVVKLLIITFITALASSMLGPMLMIYLQDYFTEDLGLLAFTFIPSTIVYSVLPMRMGRMSDRYGRVRGMIMGLLISGGIVAMIPLVHSLSILSAIWCIDAIGGMLSSSSELAFFYELVDEDKLGEMYGVYSTIGGIGAVIGPLIGGIVYEVVSPSMNFYLEGIGLIMAAGLVWIFFRKYEQVSREKVNLVGN